MTNGFEFSEIELSYMKQPKSSFDRIRDLYSLNSFFVQNPVCVGYGSQELDSLVAFYHQLFDMKNTFELRVMPKN